MKQAQLGCASCRARTNRLRFGLLALAISVGSVGCNSGASDAGDQAEVGPIEAMYLMSAAMVQAQNRIQEEAVQSCMRERGFDYQMRLITPQQAELLANTERFDNQQVRETWYGLRDRAALVAPPTTAPDPNQATLDSMDDADRAAYLRALTLAEDNSPACAQLGEEAAYDAAYGPATEQLSGVVGEVSTRVTADPNVVKAQTAWRQCMKAAGYNYDDRDGIINELKEQWDAMSSSDQNAVVDLQSKAEALANADAQCDDSAGLESASRQAQLSIEQELARSESALLEAVQNERRPLQQEAEIQK